MVCQCEYYGGKKSPTCTLNNQDDELPGLRNCRTLPERHKT